MLPRWNGDSRANSWCLLSMCAGWIATMISNHFLLQCKASLKNVLLTWYHRNLVAWTHFGPSQCRESSKHSENRNVQRLISNLQRSSFATSDLPVWKRSEPILSNVGLLAGILLCPELTHSKQLHVLLELLLTITGIVEVEIYMWQEPKLERPPNVPESGNASTKGLPNSETQCSTTYPNSELWDVLMPDLTP